MASLMALARVRDTADIDFVIVMKLIRTQRNVKSRLGRICPPIHPFLSIRCLRCEAGRCGAGRSGAAGQVIPPPQRRCCRLDSARLAALPARRAAAAGPAARSRSLAQLTKRREEERGSAAQGKWAGRESEEKTDQRDRDRVKQSETQ